MLGAKIKQQVGSSQSKKLFPTRGKEGRKKNLFLFGASAVVFWHHEFIEKICRLIGELQV
jgi:hypothetical protein